MSGILVNVAYEVWSKDGMEGMAKKTKITFFEPDEEECKAFLSEYSSTLQK